VRTPRGLWTLAWLAACGDSSAAPVVLPATRCGDLLRGPPIMRFADLTAASGLAFQYSSPDYRAGALAAVDLDGDGLPDVIAGKRTGGMAVFRNRGGMRFEPFGDLGLDTTIPLSAIAAADLDNDGDIDLVLAGPGVAYVMANRGDGVFSQVARFDGAGTTEQVLPVDLDGDGLLDLFVANRDYPVAIATANRLIMNRGGMQFVDAGVVGPAALSWTATAFDVDGDGDQDIYVANDTLIADFGPGGPHENSGLPPDSLLRNDGPDAGGVPQFTDIAAAMGMAVPHSSMSGVLGDFDGDGQLDLFVTNLGAKKLMVRTPSGFIDEAAQLGVAAINRVGGVCGDGTTSEDCLLMSWSAALTDFDLDGHDELLVVNGATSDGLLPPAAMFVRGTDPAYHEVSPDLGCLDARGLVVTDLDGDGDQDVLVAQTNGPLTIYENRGTPAPGTWLDLRLQGTASNRDGVGAVVTATLASGRSIVKPVGSGGVLNSSNPPEAFFGLGTDQVITVEVKWPSGRRSSVAGPIAGLVRVVEP
jgi:hypothetical protein